MARAVLILAALLLVPYAVAGPGAYVLSGEIAPVAPLPNREELRLSLVEGETLTIHFALADPDAIIHAKLIPPSLRCVNLPCVTPPIVTRYLLDCESYLSEDGPLAPRGSYSATFVARETGSNYLLHVGSAVLEPTPFVLTVGVDEDGGADRVTRLGPRAYVPIVATSVLCSNT